MLLTRPLLPHDSDARKYATISWHFVGEYFDGFGWVKVLIEQRRFRYEKPNDRSIFLGRLKPFKKRFGEMQHATEWPYTSRCFPQSVMERQIYLGMYRRHRRYLTSLFLGDEERRRPSAHPGFNRPTFAFENGILSVNSMGGSVNVGLYLTIAASTMGCNGVDRLYSLKRACTKLEALSHCHRESDFRQKPKSVKSPGLPIRIVVVQRRCNRRVMIRPIHNNKIRVPPSRRRRTVCSTMPVPNNAPSALVLVIRDACQMRLQGRPTPHTRPSRPSAPSNSDVAPSGSVLGRKLWLAPVY